MADWFPRSVQAPAAEHAQVLGVIRAILAAEFHIDR